MTDLQSVIDKAFEARAGISPKTAEPALKEAVAEAIAQLDSGKLRVAEKSGGEWVTHQWLKKAVLLSFRLEDNEVVRDGYTSYFDKVPANSRLRQRRFRAGGFRVVRMPSCAAIVHRKKRGAHALIREYRRVRRREHHGRYPGHVGSCAQIGKNVHLSGGSASAACWSPCRRIRPSSRTTASSARSRWSKASWSARFGDLHGRVHRTEHKDIQPGTGETTFGGIPPGSVVVSGKPALERRQIQSLIAR